MSAPLSPEPECPDCGLGVNRPKCAWDLGGYCPRLPVREAWLQEATRRARPAQTETTP